MDPAQFTRFVIEIETTIKDTAKASGTKKEKWESAIRSLDQALSGDGDGVPNHLANVDDKEQETYDEWYIAEGRPVSVPGQRYVVELVSQVFNYSNRSNGEIPWKEELRKVFRVLNGKRFDGRPHDSCATHVHVSMNNPSWTVDQVKRTAKVVMFYIRNFQFAKLANKYARSRYCTWAYAMPNMGEKEDIDSMETIEDVVRAMCPNPSRKYRPNGNFYYFDFWNLVGQTDNNDPGSAVIKKKKGTIGYRLAPGSEFLEDAITWIDFANCFLIAAASHTSGDLPDTLFEFVVLQAMASGLPQGDLERLGEMLDFTSAGKLSWSQGPEEREGCFCFA